MPTKWSTQENISSSTPRGHSHLDGQGRATVAFSWSVLKRVYCYFNATVIMVQDSGSSSLKMIQNLTELSQMLACSFPTNVRCGQVSYFRNCPMRWGPYNLPHGFLHRYKMIHIKHLALAHTAWHILNIIPALPLHPSLCLWAEICVCARVCARTYTHHYFWHYAYM